MEKVNEEQDPDSGFDTSIPTIPPGHNDKQNETANAARKIAEIAVIRSLEEITPLLIRNNDDGSIHTDTTKDAFDYMDMDRQGEGPGWQQKKEPKVGVLIEIDDEREKQRDLEKHSNTQRDEKKVEKSKKFDETSKTVDETSKKVDEKSKMVDEKSKMVDEKSKMVDETSKTVDETSKKVEDTSKKVDEISKFPVNAERRDQMDGFTRLTSIPEIIIGEIDKQEATHLYEQLLGVGKNFLDWLNVIYNFQLNSLTLPTAIIQDFHLQQRDTSNTEHTKALQQQILSIEAEYNKLKCEGNSTIATMARKIDYSSYNKGQALCKHKEEIKPRLFHPYSDQESTSYSNRCNVNNIHENENGAVCPCHIEKRLVKLEQSLKNHDGDFTNVIAELRACLDYCNSQQLQSHDVNAVIRARITKLTDIVELHRKALEDWKVELRRPRRKMISKK